MRLRTIISALSALVVFLFMASTCSAYLLDKVEAVVNDELIMKSDVDRAVGEAGRRRGISEPEALAGLRDEALNALIERKLILADARRFNIVDVTQDEVDTAIDTIRSGYDSEEEFLAELEEDEITLEELRDEVKDQLLALKYVDRRVRFFVRVTLDDARMYYEEHEGSFGGRSFAEAHDEIRTLLVEIKTNEKLDQYIADLRARSKINIVGKDDVNR